jgi:hypothetical protein
MTNEQMRDLVKECGLDWHRGFMPLFEGDETNRYAVLIAEAMLIESDACVKACEDIEVHDVGHPGTAFAVQGMCINAIRARNNKRAS